jgi:hypothetical protein
MKIFEAFFEREVYIRLTEERKGFVCTIRRGRRPAKSTKFKIEDHPVAFPDPPAESRLERFVSQAHSTLRTLLRLPAFTQPRAQKAGRIT